MDYLSVLAGGIGMMLLFYGIRADTVTPFEKHSAASHLDTGLALTVGSAMFAFWWIALIYLWVEPVLGNMTYFGYMYVGALCIFVLSAAAVMTVFSFFRGIKHIAAGMM